MGKNNMLGERIKRLRQEQQLTQAGLARALNCTQAALSQYENGNREPSINDLINIADILHTSTDYLLGITHISSKDENLKSIGDYLGLSEEAIATLHELYRKHDDKIRDDALQEEVKFSCGALPEDAGYGIEYEFWRRYHMVDLEDYKKILNSFICSVEFRTLIECLQNNLYIERVIFDMLKVIAREYDSIESPLMGENIAEKVYGLIEDSEFNLKRYSLNLFDTQTAINDFCQNFTQLEEIKRLDYSDSFYRKMHFCLYHLTRPMFETNSYSVEEFEKGLEEDYLKIFPLVNSLLKEKIPGK